MLGGITRKLHRHSLEEIKKAVDAIEAMNLSVSEYEAIAAWLDEQIYNTFHHCDDPKEKT